MLEFSIYIKAILMGLVEGLTEFLPVSSTGHLILFGDLIRFTGPRAAVFDVVIQSGAIAAVLLVYRARFFKVVTTFTHDKQSQKFILLLLIAFLPCAIVGILTHHLIKEYLFNTHTVALSLIIGGFVMLIVDRMPMKPRVDDVDAMNFFDALKIGLFQVVAMIPGVSRSGATIIGGMLSGLSKKTAAEFSFFLAVPTLLAAGLFDLYQNRHVLEAHDWGLMAVGFLSSFFCGFMVIVVFIQLITRVGFTPFAIYRIVLGSVLLLAVKT
jgi:undecaprenyl-diphosphatase